MLCLRRNVKFIFIFCEVYVKSKQETTKAVKIDKKKTTNMKKLTFIILFILLTNCNKEEVIIKKHGTVFDTVRVNVQYYNYDTIRKLVYDTIRCYDTTHFIDTIHVISNKPLITDNIRYKTGVTTITRTNDNQSRRCYILDNYFWFDFSRDIHVSNNGDLLWVLTFYNQNFKDPVFKNYYCYSNKIEFDMKDYNDDDYSHYVVYPLTLDNNENIINGETVDIYRNETHIAKVILPKEEYGKCEILSSTIGGLSAEGQFISSSQCTITIFIRDEAVHRECHNWSNPMTNSKGQSISGSWSLSTEYCTNIIRYN